MKLLVGSIRLKGVTLFLGGNVTKRESNVRMRTYFGGEVTVAVDRHDVYFTHESKVAAEWIE